MTKQMAYYQRMVVDGVERIGRRDTPDPDFPVKAPHDASDEDIRALIRRTPERFHPEMSIGLRPAPNDVT